VIFETKYDMGQTVHVIQFGYVEKIAEACPTCLGTGQIAVQGEAFVCPRCRGKKHLTVEKGAWYVSQTSAIGQVEVRTCDRDEDNPEGLERRYMLHATGVRSGSVYQEHELWGGSREDAQAEADRRNADGERP
jgi:hypothetical protein